MVNKPGIDQTGLDRLLLWLDPDVEKAALKYEKIRCRLIEFFTNRGFQDADRLADVTIDRVISKVPEVADTWKGDPLYFFIGVAKNIARENRKPPRPVLPPPPPPDPDQLEVEDRCLRHCMALLLSEDESTLILEYVGGNIKQRHEQCEKRGITANAMRIRVFQIKKTLRPCLQECFEKHAA